MKIKWATLYNLGNIVIISIISFIDSQKFDWLKISPIYHYLIIFTAPTLWVILNIFYKHFLWKPCYKHPLTLISLNWTLAVIVAGSLNFILLTFVIDRNLGKLVFPILNLFQIWFLGWLILLLWYFLFSVLEHIYSKEGTLLVRKMTSLLFYLVGLFIGIVILINGIIGASYKDFIKSVDSVPQSKVAIIFGAGVYASGYPSAVLSHRIEKAADLYFASKVQMVILSGVNDDQTHELDIMAKKAIELGIPEEAILVDANGYRTIDSCSTISNSYEINNAILITQKFHLPRALYLCNHFGIRGYGVVADDLESKLWDHLKWYPREFLATALAWFEVNFR